MNGWMHNEWMDGWMHNEWMGNVQRCTNNHARARRRRLPAGWRCANNVRTMCDNVQTVMYVSAVDGHHLGGQCGVCNVGCTPRYAQRGVGNVGVNNVGCTAWGAQRGVYRVGCVMWGAQCGVHG